MEFSGPGAASGRPTPSGVAGAGGASRDSTPGPHVPGTDHRHGVPRVPKAAVFEITSACNLRCIHCEGSAGPKDPDELTTAEALALIDDLAALGCTRCSLSGGEPLLRRDWPLLAGALHDHGVEVQLITNGTYLDEAAVAKAVEAGVHGVALSLDGAKETHDTIRRRAARSEASSFDEVFRALDRLEGTGLKRGVITHINTWNIGELPALHDLLAERRVDVWQLQLAIPEGRLLHIDKPYVVPPERLEEVVGFITWAIDKDRIPIRVTDTIGYFSREEPRLRGVHREGSLPFFTGCWAGWLVVSIESNGTIKGCPSMPAPFVAGNVREEPLAVIWADEERFAYNTRWCEDKLTGYCRTCAYRRLCRAGCTSYAFAATGTIYENPFCLHRVRATRAERRAGGVAAAPGGVA